MKTKNIIIKLAVFAILLTLYLTNLINGWVSIVLLSISLFFVVTGLFNFKPVYEPKNVKRCCTSTK